MKSQQVSGPQLILLPELVIQGWSGDQPTAAISWHRAARFCNYLTTGNIETGVYTFTPGSPPSIMDHQQAGATYGTAYFLPTENEWYKAAYFKKDRSGYSLYANGQNAIPTADNGWNYKGGAYDQPWDVGTGTEEQNGTYDMMGNGREWNETQIGSYRIVRGGSYVDYDNSNLKSSFKNENYPFYESYFLGFRVASIPEPATLLLVGIGALALRKHK